MHHEISATKDPREEVHARHVDWLFEPVYREIERRLEESNVEKTELYETAHRIEAEALKGSAANAEKVMRWLRLYQEVAPDILELATAALLKPDADVAPAIRATAEKFTLQPAHH